MYDIEIEAVVDDMKITYVGPIKYMCLYDIGGKLVKGCSWKYA